MWNRSGFGAWTNGLGFSYKGQPKEKEREMKYNDQVKVIGGFYEDLTGTVFAENTTELLDSIKINNYTVLIEGGHKIIIYPEDLQLSVKKQKKEEENSVNILIGHSVEDLSEVRKVVAITPDKKYCILDGTFFKCIETMEIYMDFKLNDGVWTRIK